MSRQDVNDLSRCYLPYFHRPIVTSTGKQSSIWTKRYTVDLPVCLEDLQVYGRHAYVYIFALLRISRLKYYTCQMM